MEDFRVPKREVPARILLDDGRLLDGTVFTAISGREGGPQRVAERLNDPEEEFLPVGADGNRFLLNKSGIITVEIAEGAEEEPADLEAGRLIPVRMTLTGGVSVIGRLHVVMPAERSRVLDYMNAAPRFLPLLGEGKVTLIQRSYIVSVLSEL
jgi:hypothetical protein